MHICLSDIYTFICVSARWICMSRLRNMHLFQCICVRIMNVHRIGPLKNRPYVYKMCKNVWIHKTRISDGRCGWNQLENPGVLSCPWQLWLGANITNHSFVLGCLVSSLSFLLYLFVCSLVFSRLFMYVLLFISPFFVFSPIHSSPPLLFFP